MNAEETERCEEMFRMLEQITLHSLNSITEDEENKKRPQQRDQGTKKSRAPLGFRGKRSRRIFTTKGAVCTEINVISDVMSLGSFHWT